MFDNTTVTLKNVRLTTSDWVQVIGLMLVFFVAAVANIYVLTSILRSKERRKRLSSMSILLFNLAIADLIVVFTLIPSEIFWSIAGHWYAGNVMCKAVQFGRAFGLFLSSMILISVNVDRFYAIVYPLRSIQSGQRVRIMISCSWSAATFCSIPQAIIFRLETKQDGESLWMQCLSIWVSPQVELANTLLHIGVQYILPLFVIVISYGGILYTIRTTNNLSADAARLFLRRNGISVVDRAKMRTLKLTAFIILAYIICWTPYSVIAIWAVVDSDSVHQFINPHFRHFLFHMVMANSCVNPIIYGIFLKRQARRLRVHSMSMNNTLEVQSMRNSMHNNSVPSSRRHRNSSAKT